MAIGPTFTAPPPAPHGAEMPVRPSSTSPSGDHDAPTAGPSVAPIPAGFALIGSGPAGASAAQFALFGSGPAGASRASAAGFALFRSGSTAAGGASTTVTTGAT